MNSGNSSLPPSSDRPGQQAESTARPKSRRKQAGQAGRMERTRSLIPTEACDRVVHHRPGACSDCGAKLSGDDQQTKRPQVTDIPPVKPIVTECQIHTLLCPDCGHRFRGELPATNLHPN
ncbi:MAG: IS66 family transposase zinc-finger binding domain-containing protein [Planctomycetaceae bacterium]